MTKNVLAVLLLGAAALITPPISGLLLAPAFAQAADDDGDGDDNPGPGPGPGPGGFGELPSRDSDGPNIGPDDRDDCFAAVMLRPAWLRDCERVDSTARPPAKKRPPPTTVVAIPGRSLPPPASVPARRESLPDSIRREILALGLTAADISALIVRGFVVIAQSDLSTLGRRLVRLAPPTRQTTPEALALLRNLAPNATSDFNHLYGVYRPGSGRCDTPACKQRAAIGWPPATTVCEIPAKIGLIDTLVDAGNPAITGQTIEVVDGLSPGRAPASPLHGTAIAALLGGRSDTAVPGLLPRATVVAVSVFHRSQDGGDIADAFDIVRAVDLLVGRGIRVVNMSFAGPDNRIFAEAVRVVTLGGAVMVAASGNAGPSSPPLYPAAYAEVVAVTGVDAENRIYRRAIRGRHLDFSGPGVDVQVISTRAEPRFETGTSFAAPFVSAAIAAAIERSPAVSVDDVLKRLQSTAVDLGTPGKDPIFGWGLVQSGSVCQ